MGRRWEACQAKPAIVTSHSELDATEPPLVELLRADALVEGLRPRVPVEHHPLESPTPPRDGERPEMPHDRRRDAAAAGARMHEQVLEEERRLHAERRVAREDDR